MISYNGYTIMIQNYYDTNLQYYRNILILNKEPIGPLNKYIKKISMPYLSPFTNSFSNDMNNTNNTNTCLYAIIDFMDNTKLMCVNNIPDLFSFLINNGYIIDYNLTKIIKNTTCASKNNLICYITYTINTQ
jgi:hypothetical protein